MEDLHDLEIERIEVIGFQKKGHDNVSLLFMYRQESIIIIKLKILLVFWVLLLWTPGMDDIETTSLKINPKDLKFSNMVVILLNC